MVFHVCARRLLRYLETHGEGAVVRPWVWIAYLFLGPALGTIAFQLYIFIAVSGRLKSKAMRLTLRCFLIQTGTLVRVSAIVTQLVFEHALRIRMKAETSSSTRATPAATPDTRSEAATPDNASIAGDDIVAEPVVENGEENGQSIASSSIKGKQKEDAPPTLVGEDVSEDPGKSSNLVGKMNNLISTDLDNLVDGRDFLLLGSLLADVSVDMSNELRYTVLYLPFQIFVCMWFLYSILGWSAFVGTVAMLALFPIPGVVASKIQKVQKETMKRVGLSH